jgi:hypothetical protein
VLLTGRIVFSDTDHAMVAIGPIEGLPSYERVREQSRRAARG